MKYEMLQIVGKSAITLNEGQKVFDLIRTCLDKGEAVELDFNQVEIVASPFFNASVGQLYRDFKVDDLNRLVKVINLNLSGQTVLQRVLENSKKYYNDENARKAFDTVLKERVEAH